MPTGMVSRTTSLSGSEATTNTTSESEEDSLKNLVESDGYDYPQPTDKRLSDTRDERRYRLLLSHGFHPSRKSLCVTSGIIADVLLSRPSPVEPDSGVVGRHWISAKARGNSTLR